MKNIYVYMDSNFNLSQDETIEEEYDRFNDLKKCICQLKDDIFISTDYERLKNELKCGDILYIKNFNSFGQSITDIMNE